MTRSWTSGAPTTTAMWPACKRPWTAWVWTAPTAWIMVLMQLVNLLQDGQPVRMSKRSGKAIALHDLLDEVSVDAARYFFNSRSATSPVDFDLDLAVREDSENPVYYVQYAHARICTLIHAPGGGRPRRPHRPPTPTPSS